jgi:hypothetical protein
MRLYAPFVFAAVWLLCGFIAVLGCFWFATPVLHSGPVAVAEPSCLATFCGACIYTVCSR